MKRKAKRKLFKTNIRMKKWFSKGRGSKPRQLKDAYKLPTLAFTRISLSIKGANYRAQESKNKLPFPS